MKLYPLDAFMIVIFAGVVGGITHDRHFLNSDFPLVGTVFVAGLIGIAIVYAVIEYFRRQAENPNNDELAEGQQYSLGENYDNYRRYENSSEYENGNGPAELPTRSLALAVLIGSIILLVLNHWCAHRTGRYYPKAVGMGCLTAMFGILGLISPSAMAAFRQNHYGEQPVPSSLIAGAGFLCAAGVIWFLLTHVY
ncbi:MAG: hypothetical protein ACRC8S_20570 [Fimbriiglobus sp.]